jgi:hypothetical protein
MSANVDWNMKNAVHSWVQILKDTRHLARQMSHSDCALIEFTKRDGTFITLSCVLFNVIVDSGWGWCYCLYRFICVLHQTRLSLNPDDLSAPINPDWQGLLYLILILYFELFNLEILNLITMLKMQKNLQTLW